MQLLFLRPLIRTHHFDETIAFYTETLGFVLRARNDDWEWASLFRDKTGLMIGGPNPHLPFDKPDFTGSFYFSTDDVESLWEDLKDKTRICYPIETFEWGMREFAIYDNNGYILQFGQEVA